MSSMLPAPGIPGAPSSPVGWPCRLVRGRASGFGRLAGALAALTSLLLLSGRPLAVGASQNQRARDVAPASESRILSAAVEALDAARYELTFTAAPDAGPVAVYASASPSIIGLSPPLLVARSSPVVLAPRERGRVYFHLKPTLGPVRVVSVRRLPLEGAANFRDLGGYGTSDGRFVRWGVLYRSDHLGGLTASDYAYIGTLGIRLVCDLRTSGERSGAPTTWQGSMPDVLSATMLTDEELNPPVPPRQPDDFPRRVAAARRPPETSGYDRFVTKYVGSYAQVLRRLVSGDVPAVTHCSAGRDRTGVYSAIVLTLLGVPWDTVLNDYLLTNRYWLTEALIAQRQRLLQKQYQLQELPASLDVRTIYTLHARQLEMTFETIRREYGSFDAFRRSTLKVSDAELEAMRARFLEP